MGAQVEQPAAPEPMQVIAGAFLKLGDAQDAEPDADYVRGVCPNCGAALVSNLYLTPGAGYQVWWECWQGLVGRNDCTYRLCR